MTQPKTYYITLISMKAKNWKPHLQDAESSRPAQASVKRIFIVDDHPVFREGMRLLLTQEPDLRVCGEAAEATKAFQSIRRLRPDLVLIDITLPGESGLQLIKKIRAVNRRIRILAISMHDEAIYANRVLRAGGNGYIMKQKDPDEIVHVVRDILAGHIYVSEEVLGRGKQQTNSPKQEARLIDQLSDLELEILQLLGRRKSNPEIARLLNSEAGTVTSAREQIRCKLKLKSPTALLRYAVNWMEPWLKTTAALTPQSTPADETETETLPKNLPM